MSRVKLTHHVVAPLLAGNWIDEGEALIFGDGRIGDVYLWKGRQLGEKRLYISPEPNLQFEKSDGIYLGILACVLHIGWFQMNIKPRIEPACVA